MRLIITVQNFNVEDLTYAWFGEFLWTWVHSPDLKYAILISARSAEITSGIICSCFPVLPSFFRHLYGKATIKRHNDNSALFSYREFTIQSPAVQTASLWNDPNESRQLQRTYLEPQEHNYWELWDVEEAPEDGETAMTTITRERARESQETITLPAAIRHSMKDMEHEGMQPGLLKTNDCAIPQAYCGNAFACNYTM